MLSIVIVNWNTKDALLRCLSSIRQFPPERSHEVIVVDNDSNDGSAQAVADSFPEVKLICSGSNLGYAAGNNRGIAVASGDLILTLNPDTEFCDLSLELAAKILEANPSYGALGVRLVLPDGSVQKSVRGFPTYLGLLGEISFLRRLFPRSAVGSYRLDSFDYSEEQAVPQPMGSFLLFRRSALETVGDPTKPFDERFPIFFNEVDLLYRLYLEGWPCLYTPRAGVRHLGGDSTKQVKSIMIWESHRSLIRYMKKHHGSFLKTPALVMLIVFAYLGAFVRARSYHRGFGY